MGDNFTERDNQTSQIREFIFSDLAEISALQKGRITRLTHPKFGRTYFIDVTDRRDPSRRNPEDVVSEGDILGEVFKQDLDNPAYNDRYATNNGVVAMITNRIDPQGRKRLYVGLWIMDLDDPKQPDITTRTINDAGIERDYFYVPFSADPDLVKDFVGREIQQAVIESGGDKDMFEDLQRMITPGGQAA